MIIEEDERYKTDGGRGTNDISHSWWPHGCTSFWVLDIRQIVGPARGDRPARSRRFAQ